MHFISVVLLSEEECVDLKNVYDIVECKLERYCEHLEVESLVQECYCIGLSAESEVEAECNRVKEFKEFQNEYAELPKEERTEEKWAEIISPREKLYNELLSKHPLRGKPNFECNICKGSGYYESTSNPEGKWDYWVIGGRWDGTIYGPENEKDSRDKNGFNLDINHHSLSNNLRKVSEIPLEKYYVPYAIITPDGEWHESSGIGRSAMIDDDWIYNKWNEEVFNIYRKYSDYYAICLDMHT